MSLCCLVFTSFLVWLKHILDERFFYGKQFREFLLQFWCIHLIVAPSSNNYFGLLLQSEVCPLKTGVNVVSVHLKDLIVADNTRVCEVPDSPQVPLRHLDRNGQKLIQDGHAVRDVDHFAIARDLRDEVAWVVQIRWDRHANPESANIVIFPQKILNLKNKTKSSRSPHQDIIIELSLRFIMNTKCDSP